MFVCVFFNSFKLISLFVLCFVFWFDSDDSADSADSFLFSDGSVFNY